MYTDTDYDFILRVEKSKYSKNVLKFTLSDIHNREDLPESEELKLDDRSSPKYLFPTYETALLKHKEESSSAKGDIRRHQDEFLQNFNDWLDGIPRIRR